MFIELACSIELWHVSILNTVSANEHLFYLRKSHICDPVKRAEAPQRQQAVMADTL